MKAVHIYSLIISMVCLVPGMSHAQSVSVADIIVRMDEIIKEMQSLKTEFDTLSTQVKPSGVVLGATTKKRLTHIPQYGETNDETALIQKLLKTDPEIYPYGVVSGFFGPKTEEAIKNLQSRFGMNPVGVVGPATTELLEAFFAKYPDDNFPSDALASDPRGAKPIVLGDSTFAPTSPTAPATPAAPVVNTGNIDVIHAAKYDGGAEVAIFFNNDNVKEFDVDGDTEAELLAAIAKKTGLTAAVVTTATQFVKAIDVDPGSGDKDDAKEALEEAEEALEDAEDEIDEAEEDGDDTDWAEDTLEEAEELFDKAEEAFDEEDYEDAIKYAEKASKKAKDAEDRIDEEEESESSDLIDEILVEVSDNLAEVTVYYDDDSDEEFEVEEDERDEIIEAIAKELDIDEDEVEDVIEFDYGDIDSIDVEVENGEAEVTIKFTSGVKFKFTLAEDNEDDIIKAIADLYDLDEDDVEDEIDIDFND